MAYAVRGVRLALVVVTLATTPFGSPVRPAYADEPLSFEQAVAALCKPEYKWDCDWVVNRAWQESRFEPWVVNYDCDSSGTYQYRCYGLLQIEAGHAPNGDVEALKDVAVNIYISYQLYLQRGKGPWGG